MRFIVGLVAMLAVAALAVVAYSVATGKDLGELAKDVQKNIDDVDVDAIRKRINEGVATVESAVSKRSDEIRDAAADVEAAAADKLEAAPA
jgi:hypothetical protein